MNVGTELTSKLHTMAGRGVVVAVSPVGTLQVRPGSLLTSDERVWLRANTGAILAHLAHPGAKNAIVTLSGNEPWNLRVAIELMHEADGLIGRLGVDGRHPEVVDAAAVVSSAFATRDLETVRLAVAEFAVVVHAVALRARRQKQPHCATPEKKGGPDAAAPG